jgi:hypothetical protein
LVLADQWLAGMAGVEFLYRAHALYPTAKRSCSSPAGTTSMIRNYLGFPRGISGVEPAARATEAPR